MRTLEEYAKIVLENSGSPHELAELQVEMAAKYALLTEGYKPIKVAKAGYWSQKYQVPEGEKPLSDRYLETQWEASELGMKEIKLKMELEGLDRLISACKAVQFEAMREAKNQL